MPPGLQGSRRRFHHERRKSTGDARSSRVDALHFIFPPGLGRFAGEFLSPVLAHAREELSPQDRVRIEAFFRGELGDVERRELLPLLGANVAALEFLAALLAPGKSCGEEE